MLGFLSDASSVNMQRHPGHSLSDLLTNAIAVLQETSSANKELGMPVLKRPLKIYRNAG